MSLLEQLLSLRPSKQPRAPLASLLGVEDVGSHPYVAPPQADINGPIDEEAVRRYLRLTGSTYPVMPKVNPEAWAAALESMPLSINIEDRRGRVEKGK